MSKVNAVLSFARTSERLRRRVYRTRFYQSFRRRLNKLPPLIERPIFIVGTVRSGTTLLARCLGRHSRIMYVRYELTAEWSEFAGIEIARSTNKMASCPPYTDSDVSKVCCDRVRRGFAEMVAIRGGTGNTRFLNKNPHLWNKLPFLRAIFPDATLIVTSRDIRSTVASMLLLWERGNSTWGKRYYFPRDPAQCWGVIPPAVPDESEASRIFPGGEVTALAEYWLHTYEMIQNTITGFHQAVPVKHAEFVSDSQSILNDIFGFCDLTPETYPLPVELDASRNDRWLEILTPKQQCDLDMFIEDNQYRFKKLLYADITV